MERRNFLKKVGAAGAAAGAMLAGVACEREKHAPAVQTKKNYEWRMVTTWPKNFPGLGTGANYLADTIEKMTDGRLKIKVYGAGELVPAFGAFDAVSEGTAEMGHAAAYYWKGKSPATQFFTTVPFGLNAPEMAGWINYGGGQKLWDDLYAEFNLKPFPAGNTGVQMGGWFNKEINSLKDYQGLKMRMPGLGGEVIKRAGATPVSLPGGEIFEALQSGSIDATEWVGPYNDLAFGFYKVATYYYWPGWHEPGAVVEAFANKKAYDALPDDFKAIIAQAAKAAYNDMYSEFTARNNAALVDLVTKHNVQLKRFPDEVLRRMGELSVEVVEEVGKTDPTSKVIFDSFNKFRKQALGWDRVGEAGFSAARSLVFNA